MKCPICATEMKALLTSTYCPNAPHDTTVGVTELLRIANCALRLRIGDTLHYQNKVVEVVGFAEFEDAVIVRYR